MKYKIKINNELVKLTTVNYNGEWDKESLKRFVLQMVSAEIVFQYFQTQYPLADLSSQLIGEYVDCDSITTQSFAIDKNSILATGDIFIKPKDRKEYDKLTWEFVGLVD